MLSPLYGQLSPLRIPNKVRELIDSDAIAYITAVQTADGQALEDSVKFSYEDFILGCKSDGIWTAIKAACILAGARTLSGAIVPLVGPAPTNLNFVSGDYIRNTGLKGNGSTKYLNSNVAGNSSLVPQDNVHLSTYITDISTSNTSGYLGNASASATGLVINTNSHTSMTFNANGTARQTIGSRQITTGLYGVNRNNSTSFSCRGYNGIDTNFNITSTTRLSGSIAVFGRALNVSWSNKRQSFYSIGESLDLAKLDARVSTLMTALAAAIP
jgi:hypothetical protein